MEKALRKFKLECLQRLLSVEITPLGVRVFCKVYGFERGKETKGVKYGVDKIVSNKMIKNAPPEQILDEIVIEFKGAVKSMVEKDLFEGK